MTEERRIQLVAEVDTTGTRTGFNEIGEQAGTMAASVTRSGEQAQRAVSNIGSGADRSARDVEASQRNLIASIQRTTAAMQAGTRSGAEYYEVLARQRGVDPAALTPYLTQLRAIEAQQRSLGVSAGQTANALRGVPAQVTDIVTSLQGGQAPLTVFLQQGGQLRDMFGGTGAAARALASYLVSLISPLTLAAGAAVVLVTALHQGEAESKAFSRSLIVSGNAAGTTAGQLTDMARAIKEATGGTQGAASAALAALAGTGQVSVQNLREFGAAAAQAQKAGVQGVEDTAKAFASLGKSPLQTSLQLTEQYRYLTGALYTQIKALEDQGRVEEAAELAQRSYASALDERANKMVSTLGTAEKAWAGLTGAAKKGWDAVLDVGREDTLEQKLAAVQAKIAKANDTSLSPLRRRDAIVELPGNEVLARLLQGQIKMANEQAAAEAATNKQREAGVEWAKQLNANLSRQQQLQNELTANRNRGEAAGAAPKEISDQALLIRQKYSDIFNDGINSQIESIKQRGEIEDMVAKRSLDLLVANRNAGLVSEAAYTEGVAQIELAAFARRKQQLQEELALTSGKLNSQKDQATLRSEIAKQDVQITSRQMQLTSDLNSLRIKGEQEIAKQIQGSVLQRSALNAGLAVEYQLYGKTADAREIAMISLKSEADLQKKIADAIAAKKPLTEGQIAQLREEKKALDDVTASVMGQTKALGYARQLAETNRRLAAESIVDEKQRAAALLAIDAEVWRERIAMAGEGTEAQKKLQGEFDTWYANRQMAPVVDQWKKVISNLDDNFQTGFRDMLTNGENTWSSFTKSISNTLKTALADALYQTFVKKYVVQIVSGIAGGISGGNVAAALGGTATGATSAFGSAMNLFSIGKTIYSGFSAGVAGSLGGAISTLGTTFGSQAVTAFGLGMQGGLGGAMAAAGPGATAASASAAGAGASAAAAIPIVGWIIAGMAAADGFRKEGFTPNNGTISNPLAQAFTMPTNMTNTLLEKLGVGSALANILSGASINTKLFGRSDPRVESQGVRGTVNATGIDAESYANIVEKGGWFRSTKRYEKSADITGATDSSWDATIKAMIVAVKGFGSAIGEQTTQIDGYTKSFKIALTGDAAKDQELINGLFADVGNELSSLLVPSLSKFSKEGESASTTLQRLAGDYVALDGVLAAIGLKFGAVGATSLEAREKLISLSGGIEQFASQAEFFSQNYLSESERTAAVTKSLDAAMSGLGLTTLPKTRDEFKALVQGLDLTTEPGAKLYAGLMSLSEAFASVHEASRSTADILSERTGLQNQLDQLTLTQAELIAKARAAIDPYNQALYDQVQAAKAAKDAQEAAAEAQLAAADVILKAQESARAAMQGVGNALVDSMKKAQEAAKAFRALNDALLIGDSSTLSPEQKYIEAKRQFETASPANLASAEKAFLDASKAWFGGSAGYAADFQAVIKRNAAEALKQDAAVEGIINFWKNYNAPAQINGSHRDGLSRVPFDGYIAELHRDERVQTASEVRDGDAAAQQTNVLLAEAVTELRADKVQRGAAANAQIAETRALRAEVAGLKRKLAALET